MLSKNCRSEYGSQKKQVDRQKQKSQKHKDRVPKDIWPPSLTWTAIVICKFLIPINWVTNMYQAAVLK